mgnify:CR=1 FL=1
MQDFPAAHSMDTTWFGVDAEGRLGEFFTGETGDMPVAGRAASGEAAQQPVMPEGIADLLELCDYPAVFAPAVRHNARDWLAGQRRLPGAHELPDAWGDPAPPLFMVRLRSGVADDGGLAGADVVAHQGERVAFVSWRGLRGAAAREAASAALLALHARDGCAGCRAIEDWEELRPLLGLYHYEGWDHTYERKLAPGTPAVWPGGPAPAWVLPTSFAAAEQLEPIRWHRCYRYVQSDEAGPGDPAALDAPAE